MAVRASRLTDTASRTAAGLALTVLLGVSAAAAATQAAFRDADHRADVASARAEVTRVESRVDVITSRASELAGSASMGDASFSFAARTAVDRGDAAAAMIISRSGAIRTIVQSRPVPPLRDNGTTIALPNLTGAIGDALSAAQAQAVAPVRLDGGPAVVALSPIVPADTPLTASARRSAAMTVVAVVAPFSDLRRGAGSGPIRIQAPGGSFGEPVGNPILHATITTGNDVWSVAVGRPSDNRTRAGWIVFAFGVLVSIATYAFVLRQRQRQEEAEAAAAERASHLEVIASTSAALQQSLELAELLPTFCVQVAGQFRRSCVSIEVADDDGRMIEVFRYGTATEMDASTQIDLRRGWRVVGRLTARGAEPLDDVATQSLHALGDLLAVSINNAALYQREQQAVARLSELDALKNAFLGTVSHELRTSTTAVQGFGDLLTDHWDQLAEDRRRELAGRIRRQAGSLRHLVDDLLDYARLEHDSLRVSPRRVELSDLVRQLAESMAPLTPTHQLNLEIDEGIDAWVDPVAVERILANLLSNAGKYAPAGSKVTVGVEANGDRARLWVSDEGPGIPAEERRRVFVRFYRLSNAETIRTRGAGIGLSILSDFAERSGATVTIDDAPGGGALIIVDFPTEPADVPAEVSSS